MTRASSEDAATGAKPETAERPAASVDAVFTPIGEGHFEPTELARGPWDPRALHGGAPAALMTGALERVQPGEELPIARLSFEFLRPVPLAPLALRTRITRPGRRVQALEAELLTIAPAPEVPAPEGEPGERGTGETRGEVVCRARALRILPIPDELPARALELVQARADPPLPGPEDGQEVRFALDSERRSFAATAMQMRFLQGRPLKGGLPEVGVSSAHAPVGAATVWMRLRHPLLPGEPVSPLARVVAAADFGNGVAAVLPFDEYLFINADLSIELDRRPEGEWIALDARTLLHRGGIGWAESVLHDERGPLGIARQALVVQPR